MLHPVFVAIDSARGSQKFPLISAYMSQQQPSRPVIGSCSVRLSACKASSAEILPRHGHLFVPLKTGAAARYRVFRFSAKSDWINIVESIHLRTREFSTWKDEDVLSKIDHRVLTPGGYALLRTRRCTICAASVLLLSTLGSLRLSSSSTLRQSVVIRRG